MSTNILTFEQVGFSYESSKPILQDFTYSLKEDAITVILGPNGVGKTTLLYLAMGWLRPKHGSVSLDGHPLQHLPRNFVGRRIALVPQEEHTPFDYSIFEYVLLGRAPHLSLTGLPGKEDQLAVQEALKKAGISGLASSSMVKISTGEKQLALIARALAQGSRILLMDEPTSHLDLGNRYRLLQTLKALRDEGMTILLTSHDPEIAYSISDETVLVGRGGAVSIGKASEVITAYSLTTLYDLPDGALLPDKDGGRFFLR